MRPLLLATVMGVALVVSSAPAAAEVRVRLAAATTVDTEDLVLGDVATVDGEQPLAARARMLRLGPAPALGAALRLDAEGVRRRLRAARLDPDRFRIEGAERAVVTRAAQVIPAAAIVEAVRRELVERRARTGQPVDDQLAVSAVIPPEDLRVPTGSVTLHARMPEAPPGSSYLAATVTVSVDGREIQTIPLTMRMGRLRQVVIAATPLPPRAVLSAAAVRVESRSSTDMPTDALTDMSGIAELEVISPVAAGDVLTSRSVRPRLMVRHGDLVTLMVEGRGFVITTQGRAADDARKGESVRVVNGTSRREVLGIAEAPGVVRVPLYETRREP
jgi:flagella basal body P-ring formation protein FlgA